MTLQIKKIHLQNWKCYENQIIEFNLNTDKNIWVVWGYNGYGKTSILEAILWCLYGNEVISPKKLIKAEIDTQEKSAEKQGYFYYHNVKTNPDLELSVSLTLQRGKQNYIISRTAKRARRGNTFYAEVSEASFNLNGKQKESSRERIDSLLPRSCREFFFFDGEKIQEYSNITQTQETRKAIESILGIPEIVNLKKDTGNVVKKFEDKIKQAESDNVELQQINIKLFQQNHEIATKRDQLQTVIEEYNQENKILDDINERANQIKELKDKLDKIKELNIEQQSLIEQIEQVNRDIAKVLENASIPMMRKFVKEMADDLQTKTLTNTRISISVDQLRELLKADTCVCGNCIREKEYNFISQQLKNIEEAGIITEENSRIESLRIDLNRISKYKVPDIEGLLLKRDGFEDDIEENKQVIEDFKKETKGVSETETDEIWRKIGQQEQSLRETDRKIERLRNEIESLEKQQNELKRQRSELLNSDRQTLILNKQSQLAQGLYKAAEELIDWYTENCQQTIEHEASRLHHLVTNKQDEYEGVILRNGYNLRVKQINGDIVNPESLSEGEKEALVFAFIAGLNLASGKAAPLMMDTPFGKLDGIHQENIVKSLPQIPSQVILLATDRDLPDHLLKALKPNIAQIHKIKRLGGIKDGSVVEVEE
ncbi:AAA family ATPase [Pleurocapsales cyanobacterium LEGE 10410]|nr:AAA family ATPase [Pleurocapsales cyanobacterium LEGE 10410]